MFIVALLLPIIIGIQLVSILNRKLTTGLKVIIGSGLGLSLLSIAFYFYSILFYPGKNFSLYILFEVAVCIILLFINRNQRLYLQVNTLIKNHFIWKLALVVAAGVSLYLFIGASSQRPYGDWDAWAMWNMKARMIFDAKINWRQIFYQEISWSHIDYPLFLPITISRIWFFIGDKAVNVPIIVSLLFLSLTVGLVFFGLSNSKLKQSAFVASLVLLLSPGFIIYSLSQYADLPFGFFILSAVMMMSIEASNKFNKSLTVGLLIGAASWVKNEGIAFLMAFLVVNMLVMFIEHISNKNRKYRLYTTKDSIGFLLGLTPFLLAIILIKAQVNFENDLFHNRNFHDVVKLLFDHQRYIVVSRYLIGSLLNFDGQIFGLVPLFLSGLVIGFRKFKPTESRYFTLSVTTVFLSFMSYLFIYIITPHPLEWHLVTSMNRLLFQLYPTFIYLYFFKLQNPWAINENKKNNTSV